MGQRTITGSVTDLEGTPLVGVTIFVQGTTSGTVTDIDGAYSIVIPEGADVLVFSYSGFKTTEVVIGSRNVIDVIMEEDGAVLDEVAVTPPPIGCAIENRSYLPGRSSTGLQVRTIARPQFYDSGS